MKKSFCLFLVIVLLLVSFTTLYAEESNSEKDLSYTVKTKTYTEPFSGTIITIPEDWNIKIVSEAEDDGESKTIGFSTPDDFFAVTFTATKMGNELGVFGQLFVNTLNLDYGEMLEDLKNSMESDGKQVGSYIMLNNRKFLRLVSKKRVLLKGNNKNKEANYIDIIYMDNGFMYRFFSMTDVNYEEYKDFEKLVANTVFSKK